MALWLETDSNTNVNISSATAVGAYTATRDVFVLPQLLADQVAGSGDYVYYVTLQIAGAGTHYVMGPKTTQTAAAGETGVAAQGGLIFMRNGDVMTVYIDGLAGDTATPDVTVRFAAIPLPSVAAGAAGGLPVLDSNLTSTANVTMWNSGALPQVAEKSDLEDVIGADGDTLESLSDQLDAVRIVTDALDVSAVVQAPVSSAGHLTMTAGLTFKGRVSGLVIPTAWAAALWTLKRSVREGDDAALVQLRVSTPADGGDGLQRLLGAALEAPMSAADGTLTVNQAGGYVDIWLSDELTAALGAATGLGWDVKFLDGGGDSTGRRGTAEVGLTETRALA